MNRLHRALTCLLLGATLGLAACAAPEPAALAANDAAQAIPSQPPVATPPSAPVTTPRSAPVVDPPPMSDPLPAERMSESPAGDPASVNRSCRTNADCAVKNVGNCCGYMPACVNINAQTNPQAVQAQCAAQGMASVCGFQEISSCECVQGTCQSAAAGGSLR
jgi:hypothetical protein